MRSADHAASADRAIDRPVLRNLIEASPGSQHETPCAVLPASRGLRSLALTAARALLDNDRGPTGSIYASNGPHAVNYYEDFEVGRRFQHHWGRTITAAEAAAFATQHLLHEPALFNATYARHLGYPDLVVSPFFVFSTVLGMSVADLSESGGPFLGADALRIHSTVIPGDTLFASSVVISRRPSKSQPSYGVVEWETTGRRQTGEVAVVFRRTNLVRRRSPADGEETSRP